jgi:hypothetical protein
VRSNPLDQIAHAARVINRSEACRKVFSAIYQGKKKIKTVSDVVEMTSLPRIRVLQEAGKLCDNDIAEKTKVGKELAYKKHPFYTQNKSKVLGLAGKKKAMDRFPTKTNPVRKETRVIVSLPKKTTDAKQVTIDDIDSFAKVRGVTTEQECLPIDERRLKDGFKKILGEQGAFQDWGGESDDLFSTRLVLDGVRRNVAFGFKGKGTTGVLTPKKMGKRGDQIQRLFRTPADVFLVQYWSQIDESVIEQMRKFAIASSVSERKRILYGVIDGQDTTRIVKAYSDCFS